MDITDDLTFDEWFNDFEDCCRNKYNYHGPIDKYTFEELYELGSTPDSEAQIFVNEMNE